MFYSDQKVLIPKKVRYKKQNDNTYVHLILETTYHKEKKYTTHKQVLIGKKIDEKYMMPNDKYFIYFTSNTIKLKENSNKFSSSVAVGASIAFTKINDEFGLSSVINNVFPTKASLINSLTSYFTCENSSVIQGFKKWAFNHYHKLDSIPSESTISLFYNQYIKHDTINDFISSWTREIFKRNRVDDLILSVDSTNMNTNSKNLSIADYGHAKVNEGLPQLNLTYALDQKTGIPLYYDLYPGSIIDVTHLDMMVKKAHRLDLEQITFVLDRGYFSLKNISYMTKMKYDFLILAKKGVLIYKELINKYGKEIKLDAKSRLRKLELYGKKIKSRISVEDTKEYNCYLYFSQKKCEDEIQLFEIMIDRYEEELESFTKKTLTDEQAKKYQEYFNLTLDKDNRLVKYELNEKRFQEEIDKSGFFMFISSKDLSLYEVIRYYEKRDQIEKAYQALKSGLDFDKFRTGSNESLASKVLVSFIALTQRSLFVYKVKPFLDAYKSATVRTVINELNMIEAEKINGVYQRRYALTKKQKEIIELIGIDETFIDDEIRSLNR